MKVSTEHFEMLKEGLVDTLEAHGIDAAKVSTERHMWDCFHKAWQECRIDGNALYLVYTDAHLLTAMRKIFKR